MLRKISKIQRFVMRFTNPHRKKKKGRLFLKIASLDSFRKISKNLVRNGFLGFS